MLNKLLLPAVVILLVVKIISVYFTDFNLFGDEAQYWLWSKNIDFGYFSKPPFLAWIIRVYTELFGDSFFAIKLLPSIIYLLISWSIYNLLKTSGLNNHDSFVGCLVFLFIPAVTFSSFIISTDLFLLLFWTLSLNQLIKINEEQKYKNFVLLGIFLGLGFLSKYAAIYFIICLLFLILLNKDFRKIFLNNYLGFGLGLLCLLVIILPNILWNLNNNWITLKHTSDNANFENIRISFFRGLEFLFIQVLMLGPFLFFGGLINGAKINNIQKILLIFSLPIILIVFIEAVIVRANANWAAPALISFFIFLYIRSYNNVLNTMNLLFNFSFSVVFFGMIAINYPLDIFNRISGLNEYANKIHSYTSDSSLKNILVSDRLLFSSMKYELREKNLNIYMPHKEGEEITNHFKISFPLKKEMNENFIFVGTLEDIRYLENKFEVIKKNSPEQIFTKRKADVYEIIFD